MFSDFVSSKITFQKGVLGSPTLQQSWPSLNTYEACDRKEIVSVNVHVPELVTGRVVVQSGPQSGKEDRQIMDRNFGVW